MKILLGLLSSTLLSQLIAFGVMPIVTRYYNAEDLGQLSLFVSFSSILCVFMTLRYEQAILIPRDQADADSLFVLTHILILFFLIVFTLAIAIGFLFDLSGYWLLLPLSAACNSLYRLYLSYWNRCSGNSAISYNVLGYAAFPSLGKLLFIPFSVSGALIYAVVIGRLVVFLNIYFAVKNSVFWRVGNVTKVMREYSEYPRSLLLADLINAVSVSLPLILIGWLYSVEELGYFSLAYSVLALPVVLVCSSVGMLFKRRLSDLYRNGSEAVIKYYFKTLFSVFAFGVAVFFPLVFWGEWLFILVFGDGWGYSGSLAFPMSLLFFMQMLARVLGYAFILVGAQKENLLVQFFLLSLLFVIFYVGSFYGVDMYSMTVFYSVVYSFVYLYVVIRPIFFLRGG